jgi:putative peptidoglycan lipid II flippase
VSYSIFRAALLVTVASVFVKLAATGKEFVVADFFGRGDALDAYLIAFLVPGFIVGIVSISFNAALIPTFVQVREQKGKAAAQRLLSNVTLLNQGLLLILSGVIAISGPRLLALMGSGFGPEKLALTCRLFYVLLPWVLINGLVVTWAAVLNAGESFLFSSLTPLLTPLAGMMLLIGFGRGWGIWAYATGTVLGGLCEAVLLARRLKKHGFSILPRWYGMDAETRQVCAQWIPVMAGALLVCGVGFVDQSMAAMLPAGSVAALNYGTRIIAAVAGLASNSLSTAVTPYFSRMVATEDFAQCRRTLRTYRWLTIGLTVPITILLIAFSRPLVTLLYQRGAFSAADTAIVSRVQVMLSIQIPFYALSMLHVRLISAMKRNDLLLYGAGINLTFDVIFNLICMKYWGISGIALATSFYYIVSCTYIVIAAQRILANAGMQPAPAASSAMAAAAAAGND